MHSESLLTTVQHINWIKLMHNYHARHYMWEVSKVLVPALLTGLITFTAMRIADNRNKKRWLHDGHLKRKTELEIEIRKILLSIKSTMSDKYEILGDWPENQDEVDKQLTYEFNESFEKLSKYIESKDKNEDFVLIDEYVYYAPRTGKLFNEFKSLYKKIFELKTLYVNQDSKSPANIIYGNVLEEVKKRPEHFEAMINTYLCFSLAIERILKKLTVKKI